MLYACQVTGMRPGDALYIGDAERDIVAGKAAGMRTLAALYGYIDKVDRPENWQANDMITSPQEIIAWVNRQNQ
jgi:phosphoglycolate phosphatase